MAEPEGGFLVHWVEDTARGCPKAQSLSEHQVTWQLDAQGRSACGVGSASVGGVQDQGASDGTPPTPWPHVLPRLSQDSWDRLLFPIK